MTSKPLCKYGAKCYRKNPEHLEQFTHPSTRESEVETDQRQARKMAGRKEKVKLAGAGYLACVTANVTVK